MVFMNITIWNASAMKCHFLNLRSCGEIVLNCRNSIVATRTGWMSLANFENPGSKFRAKGLTKNRIKYEKIPMMIASGNIQSLMNFTIFAIIPDCARKLSFSVRFPTPRFVATKIVKAPDQKKSVDPSHGRIA